MIDLKNFWPDVCPIPWHTKLVGGTFWYLCQPYSAHDGSFEDSFTEANRVAGTLIKHGVNVFSPISHSHPIATDSQMDHSNHDLWLPNELAFIRVSNGLLINPSPGWRLSKGIAIEVTYAKELGKPVYVLNMRW